MGVVDHSRLIGDPGCVEYLAKIAFAVGWVKRVATLIHESTLPHATTHQFVPCPRGVLMVRRRSLGV